jgi:hypothetical protein
VLSFHDHLQKETGAVFRSLERAGMKSRALAAERVIG